MAHVSSRNYGTGIPTQNKNLYFTVTRRLLSNLLYFQHTSVENETNVNY